MCKQLHLPICVGCSVKNVTKTGEQCHNDYRLTELTHQKVVEKSVQRCAINRMSIVKCIKNRTHHKRVTDYCRFLSMLLPISCQPFFSSFLSCLLLCQSQRFPHENGILSPSFVRIGIQIRNGTHETT